MTRAVLRLIVPSIVFAFFAGLVLFGEDTFRHVWLLSLGRVRDMLPAFLGICTWLSAAWLANRLVNQLFWEGIVQRLTGAAVPRLLLQISGLFVLSLAVLGIVGVVFQKPVTGLLAATGAIGVTIGFATRSLILDAFSGITLNVDRPFVLGEWIQVSVRGLPPVVGCVREINWRATCVESPEGTLVMIPNSAMGQAVIANLSRPGPASEFEILFSFDFAVPSERVLRILQSALFAAVSESGPQADPPPKARISRVDERGVHYKVKYWLDCSRCGPGKARHLVTRHVLEQLRHAGITPAVPKVDQFTAPMPNRALDHRNLDNRIDLIARVDLFEPLGRPEIELLSQGLRLVQAHGGDVICHQNDSGASLFVVVEGMLSVAATGGVAGGEHRLGSLVPGDCFGELALLTGEPRTATVTALTDAVMYEITKDSMERVLAVRPDLAESLAEIAAARRLGNDRRLAEGHGPVAAASHASLAAQVLARMRSFFGHLLGGTRPPAVAAEGGRAR